MFLLLVMLCCDPAKEDCRLEFHKGTMSANIDGEVWSAYPYGQVTSIIAIRGNYYYEPTCRLQQILSMKIPVKKKGVFEFAREVDLAENKASLLFTFIDVDEILANYLIRDDKETGTIEITSYTEDTGKITGTFNGIAYLDRNFGLENPKDSLVITNGQFETYFIE